VFVSCLNFCFIAASPDARESLGRLARTIASTGKVADFLVQISGQLRSADDQLRSVGLIVDW
jgi:hypothetical protein